MKKFLPYIIIFVVLVGVFTPIHFANAQVVALASCVASPSACIGQVAIYTLQVIFIGILKLVSWLTGIAGLLLNYVLDFTVVRMRDNIAGITGINIAWQVIKNLMNIAFIFMLIYEGILLIIGQGNLQNIRKFIIGLVLASILINFSLFFTKILIDASNIVTIGFYNSILGPAPRPGYGLSDPIMADLGLTTFYDPETGNPSFGANYGIGGILIMGLGSGLLLIISAFVFFAVAVLFVIRFIALIILLMLSPIAYMGMALPFMQSYARQWWSAFKSQLLFAPIYMIMTWVILTVLGSGGFVRANGVSFNSVFSAGASVPPPSSIGLIFNFAVVIGLIIASLIIAKKTAAQGSALISQATGKVSAYAGGAILGGAARVGRSTLGRYGNAKANDEDLKDRAAKGEYSAKMQLAAANRFANSSFDVRATKGFETLGKQSGFDFGKVDTKKENFRAIREEQDKAAAKRAEQYKPSEARYALAKVDDAKIAQEKAQAKKDIENELHKKQTEEYFKSDAWKNSPAGLAEAEAQKAAEDHKKSAEGLKQSEDKITKMREEANRTIIPERKTQIENEIKELNSQAEAKRAEVNTLKQAMDSKQKAIEEGQKARKEYEAKAFEGLKKIKDQDEKANENALTAIYKERVDIASNRAGHTTDLSQPSALTSDYSRSQAWWRIAAHTAGTAAYVAGMGSLPQTREDRHSAARRMRAAVKGKPKITAQELKERGVDIPDATTPATPAPEPGTPAPAPEPTPTPSAPEGTTT